MDGDRQKRVGVEESSKVDWLSNLPESLLCKILLNLSTKDVVKSSVLSKSWRNLWRYVPGLDVDICDFPDYITFMSFVEAFLGFNSESHLESFKLRYHCFEEGYETGFGIVSRWINTVVDRRVKDLLVWDNSIWEDVIQMPPSLYSCESLVSLQLVEVKLASPMLVSLPCLKFMDLNIVYFANASDLETLISSCPVLETFYTEKVYYESIEALCVCSQSLLRFTHVYAGWCEDNHVVAIHAPRLQYLRLHDNCIASFILNNLSSLVEADININFNFIYDLEKRKMIRSLLEKISCVKDMTITSKTLEVIYYYSKCEQLPLFRSLSFLHVTFVRSYGWELLPVFLESCPNLKSLAYDGYPQIGEISVLLRPECLQSSLEYVDIERPLRGEAMEMKLVKYFLSKSAILKKLTVHFDATMRRKKKSAIRKELLTIPRLSTSCQVVVL